MAIRTTACQAERERDEAKAALWATLQERDAAIQRAERLLSSAPGTSRSIDAILSGSALEWTNLSRNDALAEHETLRRALETSRKQTGALVDRLAEIAANCDNLLKQAEADTVARQGGGVRVNVKAETCD